MSAEVETRGDGLPPVQLFVVGCPRSGTTWVHRILEQHPRTVITAEAALFDFLRGPWWRLYPEIRPPMLADPEAPFRERWLEKLLVWPRPRWYGEWRRTLISYFEEPKVFALTHAGLRRKPNVPALIRRRLVTYPELRERIAEVEAEAGDRPHDEKVAILARRIYSRFFRRQGGTSNGGTAEKLLVDKTPFHMFHADFILDHFPGARVLELVRDGRDVCVSMDAYKEYMPQDRDYQIRCWRRFVEVGMELRRNPAHQGRLLQLRFEELKADTPGTVRRLFDFAGLPVDAAEADRITAATDIRKVADRGEGGHVRKGTVGDWKKRLSDDDLQLFRELAGEVFEELGYAW